MRQKKQFRPSNLRAILGVLIVLVTIGGGALFYYGLGIVRDYAVSVNQRTLDAEASGRQIQELQLLKSQLAQSNSLVDKANQLFAAPSTYQSQALNDIRTYAASAGLTISNTSFSDPSTGGEYAITVTFREPVRFSQLIAFLHNVEGNLPKLQVSSLALGHSGGDADSVEVGEIKINIAVR